jgi:hypothetical protein
MRLIFESFVNPVGDAFRNTERLVGSASAFGTLDDDDAWFVAKEIPNAIG